MGKKLGLWFLSFFLLSAVPAVSQASVFTVNVFDDPAPMAAPNGCSSSSINGGRCSLREASLEVNALDGAHVIVLGEGTYHLTIPEAGSPETGDLDFNGHLGILQVTIQGVSPDKTIINADPGLNERAMEFSASDSAVTLSNLTIQNGNSSGAGGGVSISSGATIDPDPVIITNCNFLNNHASTGGGAFLDGSHPLISIDGGTYSGNKADGNGGGLALAHGAPGNEVSTVKNIVVTNNKALQGNGGGIYFSSSAAIEINNAKVDGNQSQNPANTSGQGNGGGIYISDGGTPLAGKIIDSIVTNNSADGNSGTSDAGGGAFASGSGLVQVINSTFSGNKALNNRFGGGIDISNGGGMEIRSSTFSGNSAGEGGGAFINGSGGTLKEVTNSTFSGNQSTNGGAGIRVDRADGMSLNNVTIAQNTAGGVGAGINNSDASVTIQNSIFAGNNSAGFSNDCIGTFHSAGFNIFGSPNDGDCKPDGQNVGFNTNDIVGDPKIGPLADNGGPTTTHTLLAGSPAIDGGDPAGCKDGSGNDLTNDQRGQVKPAGVHCDIGAVELGVSDLSVTKTADASSVKVGDDVTYTITVANGGPNDNLNVTLTDTLPANVTLVSTTPAQGTCTPSGGTIACALGKISNGANVVVTVVVMTGAEGKITNSVTVSGSETDPNGGNNAATVDVTVEKQGGGGGGGGGCGLIASSPSVFPFFAMGGMLASLGTIRVMRRRK